MPKNKFARGFILVFCLLVLYNIEAKGMCTANAGSDTAICSGASVQLNGAASGGNAPYTYSWSNGLGTSPNPTVSPINTTTYSLTITDSVGCTATDEVIVTVNPLPSATVTGPTQLCNGSSITLSANTGTGLSYQWKRNGNNVGGNSASLSVNQNGSYTVVVTNSSTGCSSTSSSHNVTVNPNPIARLTVNIPIQTTLFSGDTTFYKCAIQPTSNFTFNNSSSPNNGLTYMIDWGDGTSQFTSAIPWTNVPHQYNVGIYPLTMIVQDGNGCIDTSRYKVFYGSIPAGGIVGPGNESGCSPQLINFKISGTENNPPGTIYTVTFNDGTPSQVFNHPPPDSIPHTFVITSCGTSSSDGTNTFTNAFKASFIAENPCGTKAGSVVPIYISTPVNADFTISPNTACVNAPVTFDDISFGLDIFPSGLNAFCDSLPPRVWTISPSNGWTTSGSLGNTNGFVGSNYDPYSWSQGSKNLVITFTVTGIYTITMLSGNNCGPDTVIKQLCVIPIPIASFATNSANGCAPLSVQTTNTSNTVNNCANNFTIYSWSVSPPSGWTSPDLNVQSPSFNFIVSGTYIITLTVNNTCGTDTQTAAVIVTKKPDINFPIIPDTCGSFVFNSNVTFVNNGSAITNYNWSFTGGIPTTSTSNPPPAITYSSPGTYTISVTATNACGSTTASRTFTIYPLPTTPAISGNSSSCVGRTINLTASSISGATYHWSGPNGFSSSQQNPTIPSATTAMSGTYSVFITLGGCQSQAATTSVTVNPLPNVQVSSPDPTLCLGESTTVNALGGITYSWSNSASGATITVSPTSTNTYSVTGTDGNGCTGSGSISITVNPLPAVNAGPGIGLCNQPTPYTLTGYSPITGGTGVWTGTGVTNGGVFTPSGVGTFVLTYTFTDLNSCVKSDTMTVTVVNPQVANAGTGFDICVNAPVRTFTGYTPAGGAWSGTGVSGNSFNPAGLNGLQILTYTFGTGTCLSQDTIHVTVNPQPNVNVNSPTTCYGIPVDLTASGTSNSYSWSPAGGLSGSTGATVTITNPSNSTSFMVTGTITATGCANTATANVTVNPLPVVNAGPGIGLCNQLIPYTLTGYSPTTGGTGVWTGTGVTNGGVFTPSGVGTFVLAYTFTDLNSCVKSDTMTVTVVNPQVANTGTGFDICVNAPVRTLTGYTPAGGSWSGTGVSGNSFNPAGLNGLQILTYTFGSGTCLSQDTIHVAVNPQPNVAVNSPTTCYGIPVDLTASGTSNSYSWSPAGGLSGSTGVTVTVTNPSNSTSFMVTGTITATGCANTATANVTVNPLPVVDAGPNITLCNQSIPETLQGYSPTSGGTGSWSGSPYVTSSGIFTPHGTDTLFLFYTFIDNNGCVNMDSIRVEVINPTLATAGNDFSLCVTATNVNLNAQQNPFPAGGTWTGNGISNNFFSPIIAGAGNHVLLYSAGNGTCLTKDSIQVLVNPQPVFSVGDKSICIGDSVSLTASVNTLSYSWNPSTSLSANTGQSVIAFPITTITYSIIGTNITTTCKDTIQATVTVNPLPVVEAGNNITICNQPIPETLQGYSPTSGGTGIWSGSPNVTSNGIFTPVGTDTLTLYYIFTDNNGCADMDSIEVRITDPVFADAGPGDTVCLNGGNILPINFSPTGGVWSGQGIIDQTTGLFSPSIAGSGSHQLQYSFGSGTCLTTDNRTVLVHPLPVLTFNPVQPEGCFRHDVSISVSGAVSYNWFPALGLDTTFGPSVIANLDNTTTYSVDAIDQNSCRDTFPVTVTIHPLPIVVAGPDTTICNQNSFSIQLPATPQGGSWTGSQYITSIGSFTPGGNPADTGIYQVTYHFTDQQGCPDSSDMNVHVIAPTFAVAGPSDTFCLNDPQILLQGFNPPGGIFSGPGILNSQTGSFNPSSAGSGIKYIKYTFGTGTCETIDSTFFYIRPLPKPDFTYTETCIGDPTTFTDESVPAEGSITSWLWEFGDGDTSTLQNPVHTFSSNGDYYTQLAISNSVGCNNDTTIRVVIHPLPTVIFSNPPTGCPDSVIHYTLSTIDAVQYVWDFGDGTTGTGANATHVYTAPGTFIIKLIAITQFNCVDSSFSNITILERPVANFAAYPDSGCGPLKVVIRYLPQTTSGGFDFTWALGNGDTVYSMIPPDTVVFDPPTTNSDTTYYITAWVQSRVCQQIDIHRDTIRVYTVPKVSFTPDRTNGCSPLMINLDNRTKGLLDSLIVNFGDGTQTVLYNTFDDVTHTFQNTTNIDTSYIIKYIAVNGCGTSSDSLSVTVFPNVVNASIAISPLYACTHQELTLTNNSSGATYVYYDLGTGTPNPVSNTYSTVTFSFDIPGDYVIYQYIYSGDSCSYDYDSLKITVHESPVSDFEAEQERLECSGPIEVTFTNNSSGAISYIWNFGDNNTDSSSAPIHIYENSGVFNILLISENIFGCRDTLPKSILVEHRKNILNVPNAFSPDYNAPGVNVFKPTGTCLQTYKIEIFNSWGERLWVSEKITPDGQPEEGWDGYYKNELAPQDVYVWKVLATFQNGMVWPGKDYGGQKKNIGSVTLIR